MDEELRQHMDAMETRLRADIEKSETNLPRAFHGCSRALEIRVRGAATSVAGFDERLALAEERISDLERRKAS